LALVLAGALQLAASHLPELNTTHVISLNTSRDKVTKVITAG
jgi:hypothetical protein